MRQMFSIILDIIYPPRCPGCRQFVQKHGAWCKACLNKVLAVRFISMAEHGLSALDQCLVLGDYTGTLKRLLHDIKFRQAHKNIPHIAWLLSAVDVLCRLQPVGLVLPVPLSAPRLTRRGFNQTEMIFKAWADANGLSWSTGALVRHKDTLPQWGLKLAERRKNIKGAFVVTRQDLVQGKNILLVDDIFTSGSTMEECARTLKAAGAGMVAGLTIASGSP